ncbi:hypothetical protein [Propionivibrio dicarboxylicus]|uniref:Uncharacterized protein n=1 Tax=Propionivibrio dicarboxylicus TaxID=83767 RepID=A0A1G8IX18_9RHOO|nr:hypothetical protein [Propionivibrio dicarboxylicus]SDI23481.1 hypothetical protein SAMN05660652_03075 [Propionivibrio dicarboxylicus]
MIKSMFEHTPILIGLVGVVGSLYACAFRRVRRERREKMQADRLGNRPEQPRMQGSPAGRDSDHFSPPARGK